MSSQALRAQKKALRKATNGLLRSISVPEIQTQSQAITAHVLSSSFFQKSQTISCYLSMPAGEVDTWPMVDAILKAGKKLFVPKIDVTLEDGKMDLLRLHDSEDLRSLPSGVWGIKEPHNDWNGTKRESALDLSSHALDMILLPGVAFDHSMSRLGHGKGYYDRFISTYSSIHGRKPLLVALALREQILEDGKVPIGDSDWKMDVIVGPDFVLEKKELSS